MYIKIYSLEYQKVKCFNVNSNFIQFISYCMNVAYFIYTSREINLVFEIRNCSIINGKTLNLYKLFKLFFSSICEKQWRCFSGKFSIFKQFIWFILAPMTIDYYNSGFITEEEEKNRLNAYIFLFHYTAHFS